MWFAGRPIGSAVIVSDDQGEETPPAPDARPARGYKWEPFQPGHTLSLRHGAYSPRMVDPLAAEILQGFLADSQCVYLTAPKFRLALLALCRAEAQTQLLTEWLAKRAEAAGDGVGDLADDSIRSAYLLLHRAESRADRSRARLGLDPLSAARLGQRIVGAAADMARLLSGQDHLAEGGASDEQPE